MRVLNIGRCSLFAVLTMPACAAVASTEPPHYVHLYRDSFGMAHLYADREQDGFYGLGYAVGEDRLLQVLTYYVAIRGELAATFGPKLPPLSGNSQGTAADSESSLSDTVASDIQVRKFRILGTARRNFSRLPAQYQEDLRAYISGLRAFMAQHPDRTPAWAPPLEPALPMSVLDFLIVEEKNVCAQRIGAERRISAAPAPYVPKLEAVPLRASNAWAISGSRTSDGRVIFESDSHSPIEDYGTVFYPYRIKAGDLDLVSFELTGSAMPLFGHSQHFAWGETEAPRFVADCYRVKIDGNSPRRFLFDGHPHILRQVPFSIAVKGGPAVRGNFEYSDHNGVPSPVVTRTNDAVYVVSYASADYKGLQGGEFYEVAKAGTRDELVAALSKLNGYPANMVIGGADGTIMYIRPGRIPIRPAGLDVSKPLDGNSSSTEWRGMHTYADLVKLIDPPEGYISNSNVSPDTMYPVSPLRSADYPPYFGFEPGKTNSRQLRLIELLNGAKEVTVEGALSFAMDEMIPAARPWAAEIRRALNDQHELVAAFPPELRAFLEELARFDGRFSKESRGALNHFELRLALFNNHKAEMDSLCETVEAHRLLTPDQQRLLLTAAAEAQQHMLETYGRTDLAWGDVHRVGRGDIDLPIGGGILLVGVNPGGRVAPDSNANALGLSGPAVTVSTLRALSFVVDTKTRRQRLFGEERIPFLVHFTSEGAQSFAQTLWGVSDDPASPHYSDQARLASERRLRPIPQTVKALRAESATDQVLVNRQ